MREKRRYNRIPNGEDETGSRDVELDLRNIVNIKVEDCLRWGRSRDSRIRMERNAGSNTKADECVKKRS